ncbi:MAG: YraN family protein [Sphingomonadaceae bacterium]
MTSVKVAAERRGRRAETMAALWLFAQGWTILARRRRMRMIEVDLIARRGDIIALVEVKYRRSTDLGLLAVRPEAAGRLREAARQIAAETAARGRPASVRIDMIAIAPWRWPVHVRNII